MQSIEFQTERGSNVTLQVAKSRRTGDGYLRVSVDGQLSPWRWERVDHRLYGACLARPDFIEIIPIPQRMVHAVDHFLSQPIGDLEYARP